jgi:folate-dependent tRNA-U54 methylase TrmFO/GidA
MGERTRGKRAESLAILTRVGMGVINFTGVKVFSTTLARDRENMGENITKWLKENPNVDVVDKIVTQSSDKEFHCLTITLFYRPKS